MTQTWCSLCDELIWLKPEVYFVFISFLNNDTMMLKNVFQEDKDQPVLPKS